MGQCAPSVQFYSFGLVHNHTTSVMVAMRTFSVRSCSVCFLVVSTFQDRAEFFTFRVRRRLTDGSGATSQWGQQCRLAEAEPEWP